MCEAATACVAELPIRAQITKKNNTNTVIFLNNLPF